MTEAREKYGGSGRARYQVVGNQYTPTKRTAGEMEAAVAMMLVAAAAAAAAAGVAATTEEAGEGEGVGARGASSGTPTSSRKRWCFLLLCVVSATTGHSKGKHTPFVPHVHLHIFTGSEFRHLVPHVY